uniref:Uncharacterized protein n=1 Tax=Knipowitschia caucasica TaxID=637954 RepID=A0AAV2KS54_KNICA
MDSSGNSFRSFSAVVDVGASLFVALYTCSLADRPALLRLQHRSTFLWTGVVQKVQQDVVWTASVCTGAPAGPPSASYCGLRRCRISLGSRSLRGHPRVMAQDESSPEGTEQQWGASYLSMGQGGRGTRGSQQQEGFA